MLEGVWTTVLQLWWVFKIVFALIVVFVCGMLWTYYSERVRCMARRQMPKDIQRLNKQTSTEERR